MRRLVALPIKTSAVMAMVLAGGLYMAGEARQVVIRRRETDLARIIEQAQTAAQSKPLMKPSTPAKPVASEQASEPAPFVANVALPAANQDDHKRQIIVSIADRRLALLQDGTTVKTYPIAVGAEGSPSPEGDFVIINHAVNPVYRHKGKEIQPGKDNPLGTRWMGLSLKGYGIHGTNVPRSVGKAASHGCFRMRKQDVEDLYSRVQVGDKVTIRSERDALISRVFPSEDQKTAADANAAVQVAAVSGDNSGTSTGQ